MIYGTGDPDRSHSGSETERYTMQKELGYGEFIQWVHEGMREQDVWRGGEQVEREKEEKKHGDQLALEGSGKLGD